MKTGRRFIFPHEPERVGLGPKAARQSFFVADLIRDLHGGFGER